MKYLLLTLSMFSICYASENPKYCLQDYWTEWCIENSQKNAAVEATEVAESNDVEAETTDSQE